jgi:hypothetical protein
MREGKSETAIFDEIVKPASHSIHPKKFIENYNSQKMIVVCSNEQKNKITSGLTKHIKYRVNECFIRDGKKYNTGQILYDVPEGFDLAADSKNKRPRISL